MSEATLQADLQRELLRLTSVFSSGDVTVGDWSVLDMSNENAPFVIIETADNFNVTDIQTRQSEHVRSIPMTLLVRFLDWDTALLAFRDARQSTLDFIINTRSYSRSSAKLAWGLLSISNDGGVNPVYDRYNENSAESLPVYLSQRFILEVKETFGD